jgi:hypothetical protein
MCNNLNFYTLINTKKIGLLKKFQKCTIWEISYLAKILVWEKGVKNDKIVFSILMYFFTGAWEQ